MADLPSYSDIFRIGKTEALVRNPRLSTDEVDRQGSDINVLLAAGAAMGDEVMGQLAQVRAALYIGTARKSDLDRLITDRYPDLIRKQAAPSFGYADFSFSPVVTGAFVIPDGTVLSTADGIQFGTVGDFSVAVGSVAAHVPIRSVLAGFSQKTAIGKLNNIVDQIIGAPAAGMTVTNNAATFGGEDMETDDDYIVRYKLRYISARRATVPAIEQAVLAYPGITKATAFENLDTLGRPIGYIQVVVADSYTEQFVSSTTLPAGYQAQLANLDNQLEALLDEWRAAGVGVVISFGQVVLQAIKLNLSYSAGADSGAINAIALTTVIQWINNLRPGQALRLSDLRRQLRSISGLYYTGNEILSPLGDVFPKPGQVLRTSSTFTQVVS